MSELVIACNPGAFTQRQRQRYDALREQVRSAAGQVDEIEEGFVLRFATEPAVLGAVAEWIALERLCCPFLDFILEVPAAREFATVRITGPEGTKAVLREGMAQPLFSPQRLVRR
ncbi:MAG TPA: hypothetical protein VHU80_22385 [Polyangiaceae bacterium]|jgi:hypothetical protein|nr:hypothetical protein [Polyangiaceae bacterium]